MNFFLWEVPFLFRYCSKALPATIAEISWLTDGDLPLHHRMGNMLSSFNGQDGGLRNRRWKFGSSREYEIMEIIAQMEERRIVAPEVTGSSPVPLPSIRGAVAQWKSSWLLTRVSEVRSFPAPHDIGVWCNGSTAVSKTADAGSIPATSAKDNGSMAEWLKARHC